MKNVILYKLDDIIGCIQSDSSYLTTEDQQLIESTLQAVKKMISETYDFRMSSLQQE